MKALYDKALKSYLRERTCLRKENKCSKSLHHIYYAVF